MNTSAPREAVLVPGDEGLPWSSAEELFALGFNRGLLDRAVIQKTVRWVTGRTLEAFLSARQLKAPDLRLNAIYYQMDLTGHAADSALLIMGVEVGEPCFKCSRKFPTSRLLPDQFRRLHCQSCIQELSRVGR